MKSLNKLNINFFLFTFITKTNNNNYSNFTSSDPHSVICRNKQVKSSSQYFQN